MAFVEFALDFFVLGGFVQLAQVDTLILAGKTGLQQLFFDVEQLVILLPQMIRPPAKSQHHVANHEVRHPPDGYFFYLHFSTR